MKKAILGLVAACVVLGSMAGTAVADKKSTVSVKNTGFGDYEGKVKSKDKDCIKDRKVVIYHDTNGDGEVKVPPDFKIGSTRTDDDGHYKLLDEEQPPGSAPDIIAVLKPNGKCEGDETTAEAEDFDD